MYRIPGRCGGNGRPCVTTKQSRTSPILVFFHFNAPHSYRRMGIASYVARSPLASVFALVFFLWYLRNRRWRGTGPAELPIVGALGWIVQYRTDILAGMLHLCRLYEWRTFSIKWFGEKRMHVTTDPACVEHVLKTAFTRYPKGERFNSTLADLLGGGIFAVDGPAWKSQRQLMSHVFSDKSFRTVIVSH